MKGHVTDGIIHVFEENSLEFDTPATSAQYARIALLARFIAIIPEEYSPFSDHRCLLPRTCGGSCFMHAFSHGPFVFA